MKKINSICAVLFLLVTVFVTFFENTEFGIKEKTYLTKSLFKIHISKGCSVQPQEIVEYLKDNPFRLNTLGDVQAHAVFFIEPNLLKLTTRSVFVGVHKDFLPDILKTYPPTVELGCYELTKLYEKSDPEHRAKSNNLRYILTTFSLIYLASSLIYLFALKNKSS